MCAVVARADGSVDVEATSLGSARKSIATVRSEDIAELAMQGADEDLSHEDADALSKRVCRRGPRHVQPGARAEKT